MATSLEYEISVVQRGEMMCYVAIAEMPAES